MGKIGLSHIESSLAAINSLDTDYLAEIIAATLIEEGVSPDDIQIIRLGDSRMKVGKDIESVRMEYSPDDEINDCLRIYVNREGLYDVLPEGVFFLGIDLLDSTDIKKVVNQVRQYRKEEMEIRKFFSVFEDEIDRALVQMQLLERRVDRKNVYTDFTNVFTAYWPIIRKLSLEQAALFMRIIPIIHKIRGDQRKITKVLSLILGLPVTMSHVLSRKKCDSFPAFGQARLGETLVIGSEFRSGRYDACVTVHKIPRDRIPEFLGNGKSRSILLELIDMLFAADMEVRIKLDVVSSGHICVISNEPSKASHLGIDAYL